MVAVGQVITDGTAQFIVRSHVRTVNGVAANQAGEINISSAWYSDRGDGTAGALVVASDMTLEEGLHNYTTVEVQDGATLTLGKYTWLRATVSFVNNGTITADGKGAAGGAASGNIIIAADTINDTGTVTVDGGQGAWGEYYGGNGGAGYLSKIVMGATE